MLSLYFNDVNLMILFNSRTNISGLQWTEKLSELLDIFYWMNYPCVWFISFIFVCININNGQVALYYLLFSVKNVSRSSKWKLTMTKWKVADNKSLLQSGIKRQNLCKYEYYKTVYISFLNDWPLTSALNYRVSLLAGYFITKPRLHVQHNMAP